MCIRDSSGGWLGIGEGLLQRVASFGCLPKDSIYCDAGKHPALRSVVMSQPNQEDDLALVSRALGGLPIINHVLDRLGLPALLAGVLPAGDARQKLAPAAAIRVVVTNLVLGREPLYGLGEWVARYDPGLLGLTEADLSLIHI